MIIAHDSRTTNGLSQIGAYKFSNCHRREKLRNYEEDFIDIWKNVGWSIVDMKRSKVNLWKDFVLTLLLFSTT